MSPKDVIARRGPAAGRRQPGKTRRIAFPRSRRWEYATRGKIAVSTYGLPVVFRNAFLEILAATSTYYRRVFGAHAVGQVEFNVRKQSNQRLRLWTNGADRIYLTLSRKETLKPPTDSGVHHLYGITHELAHIVLYRSLINVAALPSGWGEGWAAFTASFWAVPYLFSKHGPELWPYPYDYLAMDGPERYLRQFGTRSARRRRPVLSAMHELYECEQQIGRQRFQCLLRRMLREPMRADRFVEELRTNVANETSPRALHGADVCTFGSDPNCIEVKITPITERPNEETP